MQHLQCPATQEISDPSTEPESADPGCSGDVPQLVDIVLLIEDVQLVGTAVVCRTNKPKKVKGRFIVGHIANWV